MSLHSQAGLDLPVTRFTGRFANESLQPQMKHISLAIIGTCLLGLAALYGVGWILNHHYWEAESHVPAVWALADVVRQSVHTRTALLATQNEAYTLISPEHRNYLSNFNAIWTPLEDPVYRIRINRKFGFTVDAHGNPHWLWGPEQIRKSFDLTAPSHY